MSSFVINQIKDFLTAFSVGCALGGIYDLLRIIRRGLKHNVVALSVEDLLFLILVTPGLCFYFSKTSEGSARLYLICSMILGDFLWNRLFGRYFVRFLGKICRKNTEKVRKVLKKIVESIKIKRRFKRKKTI